MKKLLPLLLFILSGCVPVYADDVEDYLYERRLLGAAIGREVASPLYYLPAALALSNSPIEVLNLGDSIAGDTTSPGTEVVRMLQRRFGISGYNFGNYGIGTAPNLPTGNENLTALSGSANWYAGDTSGRGWPFYMGVMSNTSTTITWGNATDANGILATDGAIFWVTHPTGGNFEIQTSTSGGGWVTQKTVSGLSADTNCSYTNISFTINPTRIRVNNLSGTNIVLGNRIRCVSTFNTIGASWLSASGYALTDLANVNPAILQCVFTNLNPTLTMIHFRDPPSLATTAALRYLIRVLTNCNSDIVVVGPYRWLDDTASDTTTQEYLNMRRATIEEGATFVDLESSFPNHERMVRAGIVNSASDPHPSPLGVRVIGTVLASKIGLADAMNCAPSSFNGFSIRQLSADGTRAALHIYARDQSSQAYHSFGVIPSGGGGGYWAGGNSSNAFPTATKAVVIADSVNVAFQSPSTSGGPYFKQNSAASSASFDASGNLTFANSEAFTPSAVSLTADNQVVTVTGAGNYTISSDNATAANRTFVLTSGISGKIIRLVWSGTNQGELVDDSANNGGGNVRLSAVWPSAATPQYDTLTLIGVGTDWYELTRGSN